MMNRPLSPWIEKHRQWALNHQSEVIQSHQKVKNEIAASPAKYKGKPVEFLYQPFFMTEDQWRDLEKITGTMLRLIRKVTQAYLADPGFRRYFNFPPLMEELIVKDPGYDYPVPVTRTDLFYHLETGEFQFCEINTDGSSGMVEARELQQIIGASPAVNELGILPEKLVEGEFFASWISAFLDNYHQWRNSSEQHHQKPEIPRVAIVDLFSQEPPSEFAEFQKAFQKAGCTCIIADARELKLINGQLSTKGTPIDAVYRRLVTWELVENQQALAPFIQAVLEEKVCVIGPIRSQISHNKRFFSILHDQEAVSFLNEQEREFIRKHIPYTAVLAEENSQKWTQWLEEKDRYIIKPEDRYASYGVFAGRDYSASEWEDKLKTAASQSYLIQEYCHVPQLPMAVVSDDQVQFLPFYYLIGCFVYNEVFQGPYIRAGSQSIIGSVVECFTVPAYCVLEDH